MIGIVCIMKWKKDNICNGTLKKGELIYIIVFSILSLLLGIESFVTHFVAFLFGIIVVLLLQKKSKSQLQIIGNRQLEEISYENL